MNIISIYERVKTQVTTRQAAELYGISVGRGGMIQCPFHDDKHPSMKVDRRYYCFACQARGDVIDFVAKLFHLNPHESAQKLLADFHINHGTHTSGFNHKTLTRNQCFSQRNTENQVIKLLIDYECLLKKHKVLFAPDKPDDMWNDRFLQAVSELPLIGFAIDQLYNADPSVRKDVIEKLVQSGRIDRIKTILRAEGVAERLVNQNAGHSM